MHTWIKICGTTCVEDALNSIEAGADALGFIFARSKRQVTPQQAQAVIRELPHKVERIGVFLDAGAKEIQRVVNEVDLTGIQMHGEGDSPPEVYSHLPNERRDALRRMKTVLVQDGFEHRFDAYAAVPGVVNTWLFDSGAGSGKAFDWQGARAQLGERQGQFVIAGGLTPENVGEAMRVFRPWGVDVVTGVEREPGRKDPEKLKAFVAAVRRAEEP
ncbi:MAG TPA: phosphoribosylanthranilate isomerase [Candidatus Sulfotelmatobacter sp.]|jgi:phosphoribosylanthranilate isomerase|nr:phosphoribosylanthranilate isomerase [Candidatus Sulfotelmatobacter sp.]